ncbi:MAG: class I SAM-dependent methyltransferase [Sterolibacterium sp.]|nr:class I SAM-dependent methyltransferase [Sterolibacterium sp.]
MQPLPDADRLIEQIHREIWRRNASYRELIETDPVAVEHAAMRPETIALLDRLQQLAQPVELPQPASSVERLPQGGQPVDRPLQPAEPVDHLSQVVQPLDRLPKPFSRFPFRYMRWLHRLLGRIERWLLRPVYEVFNIHRAAIEAHREAIEADREAIEAQRLAFNAQSEAIEAQRLAFNAQSETIETQRAAIEAQRAAFKVQREALGVQLAFNRMLLDWARQMNAHIERKHAHAIVLQRDIARLEEQLVLSRLRPPEKRLPLPALADSSAGADPDLDLLYLDFENRFRGPRETVKRRLAAYLDLLHADAIPAGAAVLDLGCGRGEWLELAAESGWTARGVDANAAVVGLCRERGFAAEQADAFAWLAGQPDASQHIVSAFHVVEHLDFTHLLRLIDEIRRVLVPGGVMLLETPNPCNILVGACDFYRDPTHLRPIHPDTLVFLARARGFADSRAWFFEERSEGPPRAIDSADYVFGGIESYIWISRDYGIVARKQQAPCA